MGEKQNILVYKELYSSSYGGNENLGLTIVKDYNSLIKNIENLKLEDHIYLKLAEVDFKKSNIAIIHLGQRNTGGFAVKVNKLTKKNEVLTIFHKEISPSKNDNVNMVITNPYCIIEIPKTKNTILK